MLPSDEVMNIALRLVAAAGIGAAIGLDREVRHKPAGMRTHALVSLGAAVLVVIVARAGMGVGSDINAVSRVIQGIIAGVGFLGGGAILKSGTGGEMVHGLTTAATIWLAACLGVACGAGQWTAAAITGVLALLIVIAGRWVEDVIHRLLKDPPHDSNHG
jgi:putative Mg2+ transporter-C (MgtC) family protein